MMPYSTKQKSTLYTGDNLYIMNGMNSATVDLIYTDPPFNSKRIYSAPIGSKAAGAAFKDIWTWQDVDVAYLEKAYDTYPYLAQFITVVGGIHGKAMASYLCFMMQRIIEMHRILKPSGSFYLHIDPTASHYLKIICDRIFGKDNFRNEVIWGYRTGGRSKKWFGRKHDVLLFYAKSKKTVLNLQQEKSYCTSTPPGFKGIEVLRELDGRHYTMASMRDIWEINAIGRSSSERTGYPTQKPLELLYRIIKASSNEGDLVFDPFCGCATTMVASQQLQRQWIGVDIEAKAAELVSERLQDDAGMFTDFVHTKKLPVRTDVKIQQPTKTIKQKLYNQQAKLCNGCKNEYLIKDFEIDHVIPKSKGGQDVYENYQLLCGHCNRRKGDKPHEHLIVKIQNDKRAKLEYSYS